MTTNIIGDKTRNEICKLIHIFTGRQSNISLIWTQFPCSLIPNPISAWQLTRKLIVTALASERFVFLKLHIDLTLNGRQTEINLLSVKMSMHKAESWPRDKAVNTKILHA
jgi:hypothetical protein